MKKILCVLLCLVSVVAMLTFCVSAATATTKFDTESAVSSYISSAVNMTYSFDETNKCLKIVTTAADPHFNFTNFDEYIFASEYKYFYYRFKVIDGLDVAEEGQIFFKTTTSKLGASGSHTNFDIADSENWQDIYIDLTTLPLWSGNVDVFRIDPVQLSSASSAVTIFVDSVSFCSTIDEVNALKKELDDMNPMPQWTFESYEKLKSHLPNISGYDYVEENGYAKFIPTGVDPTFTLKLNANEEFAASDAPYIAFRLKVDTAFDVGSVFFSNETSDFGKTRTNFTIINDGEWNNYILYMPEMHSLWSGTIYKLRFDFIDHASAGNNVENYTDAFLNSTVFFDRIGIFRTEEDAEEFLAKEINVNIDFPFDDVINTGAKIPLWDFAESQDDRDEWIPGGAVTLNEHGMYVFNAQSYDAMLTNSLSESEVFSADEFKVMGIRVKNMSSHAGGGFFFTNAIQTGFADDGYMRYEFKNSGEWENVIYNVTKKYPEKWTGDITSLRFDLMNPSSAGAFIYVSKIGFFRSEAEAEEYLSASEEKLDYSLPAVFKSALQKVYLPGNTVSDGYDRSDYMLSSTTPVGEGDTPIVFYTDSDGNDSVVPISDVNSHGYSRFVAKKAGNYTLGYNEKTYTDTENHWAQDYISYVSDREIFNGTSATEFTPDMPMTRGMFVTVLGRMHEVDTTKYSSSSFNDVNPAEYYAPYIEWATKADIMSPDSDKLFAPEAPLTRIDMAIAISNYIDFCGYEFAYYNDITEFDDLSEYSEDFIAAIERLQECGVIKGMDENSFDPNGITTRAEVSAVFQRLIKAITGAAIPETEYTNEDITKKRIRLGVWGFPFTEKTEVDRLRDLGVNLIVSGGGASNERVWNLCDKYGIEVFMPDMPFGKSYAAEGKYPDPIAISAEYADHPSFGGHYFTDEPGSDDFEWIGDLIDNYNSYLPNKTAFVNLLPMYANAAQLKYGAGAAAIEYYDPDPDLYRKHCQEWFNTNNANYICTDIYPLNWKNSVHETAYKTTYANYVESINQIATVAREEDKEFWCCIQTFGWTSSKRTPNEAEFRWQCYSMLSFGCTGILLWRYTGSNVNYPSMIDLETREIYQSYYDCQKVFAEMNAISDTYIEYKNLGAFTFNYTEDVPYLYMSGEYDVSDTVFNDIQCDNPLLFGYFQKIDNEDSNAFTVVNMTEFSAEESSIMKFSIVDTDKTVTSYHRGVKTVLVPSNGYYTLELECGDGAFITIE